MKRAAVVTLVEYSEPARNVYLPLPAERVRIVELHKESHLKEFDVKVGTVLTVKAAAPAVELGWVNVWPVGLACAGFCRVEPCQGEAPSEGFQ